MSILTIGLLALYAASALKGVQSFEDPTHFVAKQAIAVGFGLLFVGVLWFVPRDWLAGLPLPLYVCSLISLAAVQVPGLGLRGGGAVRWLKLGPLTWQPSELAKLAVVLLLAKNLSLPSFAPKARFSCLSSLMILLPVALLVLAQPDFGSFVLLAGVCFAMLFLADVELKALIKLLAPALMAIIFLGVSQPYRVKRLVSFLDPWSNFEAGGFQVVQSFLGFHNGGFTGVGLGESRQKLYYLPEAHTDFIMTLVAEEFGLSGTAFICLVFGYLVYLGFEIGRRQSERFFKLASYGLTSLFALQTLCNLGVVMGLLPTKGLALPLMSSGLSSLLVSLFLLGLLVRFSKVDGSGRLC